MFPTNWVTTAGATAVTNGLNVFTHPPQVFYQQPVNYTGFQQVPILSQQPSIPTPTPFISSSSTKPNSTGNFGTVYPDSKLNMEFVKDIISKISPENPDPVNDSNLYKYRFNYKNHYNCEFQIYDDERGSLKNNNHNLENFKFNYTYNTVAKKVLENKNPINIVDIASQFNQEVKNLVAVEKERRRRGGHGNGSNSSPIENVVGFVGSMKCEPTISSLKGVYEIYMENLSTTSSTNYQYSYGSLINFIRPSNPNRLNSLTLNQTGESLLSSPENKTKILHDILKGIKDLHSLNISHNDIKPENVIIEYSSSSNNSNSNSSYAVSLTVNRAILVDLGSSKSYADAIRPEGKKTASCDPSYLSQEGWNVLLGYNIRGGIMNHDSTASTSYYAKDAWAAGLVAVQMWLAGKNIAQVDNPEVYLRREIQNLPGAYICFSALWFGDTRYCGPGNHIHSMSYYGNAANHNAYAEKYLRQYFRQDNNNSDAIFEIIRDNLLNLDANQRFGAQVQQQPQLQYSYMGSYYLNYNQSQNLNNNDRDNQILDTLRRSSQNYQTTGLTKFAQKQDRSPTFGGNASGASHLTYIQGPPQVHTSGYSTPIYPNMVRSHSNLSAVSTTANGSSQPYVVPFGQDYYTNYSTLSGPGPQALTTTTTTNAQGPQITTATAQLPQVLTTTTHPQAASHTVISSTSNGPATATYYTTTSPTKPVPVSSYSFNGHWGPFTTNSTFLGRK